MLVPVRRVVLLAGTSVGVEAGCEVIDWLEMDDEEPVAMVAEVPAPMQTVSCPLLSMYL